MKIAHPASFNQHAPPVDELNEPTFANYEWDARPADPRDRTKVLAIARAHGIEPAWADCDLDPIARLDQRLSDLENSTSDILDAILARLEACERQHRRGA